MAIDIVYDSPTYNAYCTYAEVTSAMGLLEAEFGDSGWSGITQAKAENMIVAASQSLYSFGWVGEKNASIQQQAYKMQFPRTGLKYADGSEVPQIMPSEVTPRAPFEIRDYVARWCFSKSYFVSNSVNSTLRSKTVDGVTEVYGDVEKDFTIDMSKPDLAIPSNWLIGGLQNSFGGVGSIGSIRHL